MKTKLLFSLIACGFMISGVDAMQDGDQVPAVNGHWHIDDVAQYYTFAASLQRLIPNDAGITITDEEDGVESRIRGIKRKYDGKLLYIGYDYVGDLLNVESFGAVRVVCAPYAHLHHRYMFESILMDICKSTRVSKDISLVFELTNRGFYVSLPMRDIIKYYEQNRFILPVAFIDDLHQNLMELSRSISDFIENGK